MNRFRRKLCNRQLAVALAVLADSLKAGKSLELAIRSLAGQSPDPLGGEFAQVVHEIEQNAPLEKALAGMAARVGSNDLDLFLAAIPERHRNDGGLAATVDCVATAIRERAEIDGQASHLIAGGRWGGMVVGLLPLALGLVFALLQPEMMLMFVTQPLGLVLLGCALVLWLLGFFSIRWLTASDDGRAENFYRRGDEPGGDLRPDPSGHGEMRAADSRRQDSPNGADNPAKAWLAGLWHGRKNAARVRKIRQTLPEAVDLLGVFLEVGLDADKALARLVEKCAGPLADEFARALAEMRLGTPRARALQDITARVNLDDLHDVIATIIQADRSGTGLAAALRRHAEQLRSKRRRRIEQAARLAPVKLLFPMVLFIFPAIFIVILGPIVVKVDYMKSQIDETQGEPASGRNQGVGAEAADHNQSR